MSKPRSVRSRRLPSQSIFILSALTIAGFCTIASSVAADTRTLSVTGDLKVFDGDTFEVGPLLIRLHGIDAPELAQTCSEPNGNTWSCGTEAANRLIQLLETNDLSCNPLERDRYGRMISRCSVDGQDVGKRLVEEGLAWAFVEYSGDYVASEAVARAAERGIWQAATQTAWDYRADRWDRAVAASPAGCPIKGNINGSQQIYHTPWSPYYERIKMDPTKGERWFCDEVEAQAEGWRPVQSR